MIHFLVGSFIFKFNKINFSIIEDTYWKPDIVDHQEVLVKVMDTYGKVKKHFKKIFK
jgi:hypothetical protein